MMTPAGNGSGALTYKWLAPLAVSLVFAMGAMWATDVRGAVTENAVNVQHLQVNIAEMTGELRALRVAFEQVRSEGSPITDRRLTLIESRLGIKR